MRLLNLLLLLFFVSNILYSSTSEDCYIDWVSGKIYSSITIFIPNNSNYFHKKIELIDISKEKAKANYYSILKNLSYSESFSIIDYIEEKLLKNNELFDLIDNATLLNIEYPDMNRIKLTYSINIYGENSLMDIIMKERDLYTEEIKSYPDFNFDTKYTGVIIDARGLLNSFDGYEVKVKPSLFITIKDSKGRLVLNQNNIYSSVIKEKGMVRYTYDINEDNSNRIGNKPLKIVAYGVGDRKGSIIVISENDAKRLVSSKTTRDSLHNGSIVIVIDKN